MIPFQYSQRNQYNLGITKLLLCGLVFADLTAFFFLSFMNICFDTLVSDPPTWLLTILFFIMGMDLLALLYYNKRVNIKFMVHTVILILLILSWSIRRNWIINLSAAVFLRFPEIIQYNDIIQDKLRAYGKLFKLYTFCKIFYMIAVVGHVLGCIFYAIDNTLIKQQYYGPIQLNPTMYYQGSMLCYSPIYSLDQINRYVYSMYYIFSLLATVAYGDIIPKNPWENSYVCILLVLSTISISFIIQQLLIVLSDNWDTVYQILKKLKYFDSMLNKATGVTTSTRLKLVNFIYHSMLHSANNNPNIHRLTPSLQFKIMGESIGMKKNIFVKSIDEKQNQLMDVYTLPNFLADYVLLKLQLIYYPGKYMLIDNQNPFQSPPLYISSRGQLKIGYGPNFLMQKITRAANRLLCWREFIWDNKSIHPHFRIETKGLCELYTFRSESLKQMMALQREKRTSDDSFSKMLEMYYIARQKQLLLLYEESIDHYHSSQSMNLIAQQSNELNQPQVGSISKHIFRCWGCGNRTHFPINCPNLHYKINIKKALSHFSRLAVGERSFTRHKMRSRKIKPTYKEMSKQQKNRLFLQNYIQRKHQQLRNLNDLFYSSHPKIFENYEKYDYFYPDFNFDCHNSDQS